MCLDDLSLTEKLLIDIDACEDAIAFVKRNQLIGFPLRRLNEVKGDCENYVNWLRSFSDIVYDDNENLTYVERENQFWVRKIYDGLGNITHIRNSSNQWQNYEYDSTNNAIYIEYCNGQDVHYKNIRYNDKNKPILFIHDDGHQVIFEYNFFGYLILIKESSGYFEEFEYDNKNNLIEHKRPNIIIKNKYNTFGKVTKTERTEEYYDDDEKNTFKKSILKNNYDKNGNLIKIKMNTEWKFIKNGTIKKSVDGYTDMMKYDDRGNLIYIKSSRGYSASYPTKYYDNGQLASIGDMQIPLFS